MREKQRGERGREEGWEKLLLIDGHSLIHRAYHALPTSLVTRQGEVTNAVYGFANMLLRILAEEQPRWVAVAFDTPAPTFRHQEFAAYKAQRPPMPEDLRPQVERVRALLTALGIPQVGVEGFEADDILGTLSRWGEETGKTVLIVSGDRDILQLASGRIRVFLTRKGISDLEVYTPETVVEKLGVEPERLPDLKGLTGDTADNIPGVAGVGPKTAVSLLQEFQSVEGIFAHWDKLPARIQRLLAGQEDRALLSKRLATIDRRVPLAFDPAAWAPWSKAGVDYESLFALLDELEFNSLKKRVVAWVKEAGEDARGAGEGRGILEKGDEPREPGSKSGQMTLFPAQGVLEAGRKKTTAGETTEIKGARAFPPEGKVLTDEAEVLHLRETVAQGESFVLLPCFLPASPGEPPEFLGLAVASTSDRGYFLPSPPLSRSWLLQTWKPSLEEARLTKIGHDLKAANVALAQYGIELAGPYFDTMLAAYLLDPGQRQDLTALFHKYLKWGNPALLALGGKDLAGLLQAALKSGEMAAVQQGLAQAAAGLQSLREVLAGELAREPALERLFYEVELPLLQVLAGMERAGITLDLDLLRSMSEETAAELQRIEKEVYGLAGSEFKINSPKQLGEILFGKLGLPPLKKTKTGYSTDVEVLEELAAKHPHPILPLILHFRFLSKLKSTYLDALPALVDRRTGRVHTTFHQTVTATGRLSSSNPNLQNIPVRTEEGGRIRAAFIPPRPGWVLLMADYSQIELRVLAHLSQDPALCAAFQEGVDIHRRTAAEMFGRSLEEVTPQERNSAKAINFGIVYGISGFGLARGVGIGRQEAEEYIARYFARYPQVKAYLEELVAEARRRGYVTTILGRRRYLPDLHSRNWSLRQFAERTAKNTPIQGSAADLIKLAMVAIDRRLRREGLAARMLLQVHDELIFELPETEVARTGDLVREEMEHVLPLLVPLVVDIEVGKNWLEGVSLASFLTGASS